MTTTEQGGGEQAIEGVLKEIGWEHARASSESWHAHVPTKTGAVPAVVYHHGPTQTILFYLVVPLKLPDDHRAEVAEFLTRANRGLRLGAFELNWDDMEVRYRVGVDYEGAKPDLAFKNAIGDALAMYDRYRDALASVAWGGRGPADALEWAEQRAAGGASAD